MTKVRLISALSILLLVSSCAHNRIKFVKASPRKIVSIENVRTSKDKDQSIEDVAYASESESTPEAATISEMIVSTPVDDQFSKAVYQPQDSTTNEEEPKISQEAFNEAVNAEKDAKRAKSLLIWAFPAMGTPVIGLVVSLVLFGLGCLFYRRSVRSRYNTEQGQRDERSAKRLRLVYMIVLGALALLLATAVILTVFF